MLVPAVKTLPGLHAAHVFIGTFRVLWFGKYGDSWKCCLLLLQDGSGETLQLERGSEEEQRADFVAKQLG